MTTIIKIIVIVCIFGLGYLIGVERGIRKDKDDRTKNKEN